MSIIPEFCNDWSAKIGLPYNTPDMLLTSAVVSFGIVSVVSLSVTTGAQAAGISALASLISAVVNPLLKLIIGQDKLSMTPFYTEVNSKIGIWASASFHTCLTW